MKIGTPVWDEWLSSPVTDAISAESELSGLISCMDAYTGENRVELVSGRIWVFRRISRLWPLCGLENLSPLRDVIQVDRRRVALTISAEDYRIVMAAPDGSSFIRWAWARGVFGVGGGLYSPRSGYYGMVRIKQPLAAACLNELLDSHGIASTSRIKGRVCELMIRGLQPLLAFCHGLKLPEAAARLEERGLVRTLRDQVNRQTNCDNANISRSVSAARHQLEMARFFLRRGEELPAVLDEMIRLRLENPSVTLQELGSLADPPVRKSTVQYRWKKLQLLAERYGFSPSHELH